MKANNSRYARMLACLLLAATSTGCRSSAMRRDTARTPAEASAPVIADRTETEDSPTRDLHRQASKTATEDIQLASHNDEPALSAAVPPAPSANADTDATEPAALPVENGDDIESLVAAALSSNTRLVRMQHEVNAAWHKVPQAEALPDPTLGANGFGHPIETAAGSQRANMSLSQRIPSLQRLGAQGQQTAYEALAMEQVLKAEQLRITAEVRETCYRLYLLAQQTRINNENQKLLKSLIDVATQRLRTGGATQGDVVLATLELSRLEEELVSLNQQQVSAQARLNELLNRSPHSPVPDFRSVTVALPDTSLEELSSLAFEHQPELAAARMRVQATSWGVQVASLARVPDVTVNFSWFFMDDNRPPTSVVSVGEDAWSLGASVNLPLWANKYNSMEHEAGFRHAAAHATIDDLRRRYDTLLADLLEQARAADKTATLYRDTILPQARQTLDIDQKSYAQGKVDFDRVIRDFRTLLTLEVGLHRAIATLGTALARLEQATGI